MSGETGREAPAPDAHPNRNALSDQPLEIAIERRERLYDGFRPLDAVTVRHASIDGARTVGPVRREILATGSVVVVVAFDPALDAIVVIRQFRIGAALSTANAAPLELPAGLMDEGETPEEAAARELLEETGLRPAAIEFCFTMLSSPGLTDEYAFIHLAIVDASELTEAAGLAEEDEDIRPIAANVDALIDAVDAGRVENGFLVACTHWFARKGRDRARALGLRARTAKAPSVPAAG